MVQSLCRIVRAVAVGGAVILLLLAQAGCATIRVTDPYQTADQQFLMSVAVQKAVAQLSTDMLRDRTVYMDTEYLNFALPPSQYIVRPNPAPFEQSFLIAELRAKLLKSGVRLMPTKEQAQVILEVRSGGISVDHEEYLLGIPSIFLPGDTGTAVSVTTPELSILKSTKQYGYASVAFVAYLQKTGEVLALSGPFVGTTKREDYWLFGTGPNTVGNIPSIQK
ncbi:MAG TPA: DUF6655 family protein [Tepidisphaeraceae bacterium]|jgi:hypothetical protein|nr:DUF6655 family protein [Tepidisphaeraceae bacterium]